MIKIKFKNMPEMTVEPMTTAYELLEKINFPNKDTVVACRVNKLQRSLSWKLSMDSCVDFVTTDSIEGIEVYQRTLSFMLTSACSGKQDKADSSLF